MGISDPNARCRRHPEHAQSRGVCPWCLRERLSGLSSSPPCSPSAASLFDPSSDTPSSCSGSLSGRRAMSMVLRGRRGEEDLARNRSVVAAEEREEEGRKKGRGGLWRTLVGSVRRRAATRKGKGGILHSKTVKEGPSAAATWVL